LGRAAPDIDDHRVWRALKLAQLEDVVRALPQQLASMLGEDGSRVSGGQRQRLDIARALYDDPDILFLDEATAALDTVTEQEVTQAILGLSGNKTIVCIAHRLSTVRAADTIHLMEEGRITASGTYDELVRHAPSFRRMAEAGQAA
jgi:ABC-type multidrug transport system fused ATPase/permease subunit